MYTADYFVLSSTFFIRPKFVAAPLILVAPRRLKNGPARENLHTSERVRVFRPLARRRGATHLDFGLGIC
jgi:hypothetical protein